MKSSNPIQFKSLVNISLLSMLGTACGGGGGDATPAAKVVVPPPPPVTTPKEPAPLNWKFNDITYSTGLQHEWGIVGTTEEDHGLMEEIFAGGVAVGDFDGDGLEDLFIDSGNSKPAKLYKNLGENKFTDVALEAGVQLINHRGSGPIFADVNGDGWLDLFVGGIAGDKNYLFINNGDGSFADSSSTAGLDLTAVNTVSASFGDYNKDGFLDLALAHWGNELRAETENIYRGAGDGTFKSSGDYSLISEIINNSYSTHLQEGTDYSFSPTFADLNNDGWPDLTLVSDFGYTRYFLNNGRNEFETTSTYAMPDRNGMGTALGDYDNDGDLDWFVSAIYEVSAHTISSSGNRLYENMGTGEFEDSSFVARIENGGWGWGACFADFNNDGYLDIFHTNGWAENDSLDPEMNNYFTDPSRLYISKGNRQFKEQAEEHNITDTGQGRAVVCFDSDNDGDVDIIVINNEDKAESFLFYENIDANQVGSFLNVSLIGSGANTSAIGARVYVTVGEVTQMREVFSGGNFTSQVSLKQHFGLADATMIEQVRVVWPDGTEKILNNVAVNQQLNIEQE